MIQRVQTLYLLAAAALMSLSLFLPLATLWQEGGNEVVIKAFAVAGVDGVKTLLPLYLGVMLSLPSSYNHNIVHGQHLQTSLLQVSQRNGVLNTKRLMVEQAQRPRPNG